MNKKDREKVFHKYGGRCAYCGCELQKGWHADHANPVERKYKHLPADVIHRATKEKVTQKDFEDANGWSDDFISRKSRLVVDGFYLPENDTIENMMPSCPKCNNYKRQMDIEEFRKELELLTTRLNNYTSNYRTAKRFGLIEETDKKVKFYFETLSN